MGDELTSGRAGGGAMTVTLLDAALTYAAHGWAVFPLVPGTKRPLTKNGFKDATRDVEQITRWWAEHPDANIGLPTGAVNQISVVDIDIKAWKKKHGDQTILTLVQKHGPLPPTLVQQTWSGGQQLVFAYAPSA